MRSVMSSTFVTDFWLRNRSCTTLPKSTFETWKLPCSSSQYSREVKRNRRQRYRLDRRQYSAIRKQTTADAKRSAAPTGQRITASRDKIELPMISRVDSAVTPSNQRYSRDPRQYSMVSGPASVGTG